MDRIHFPSPSPFKDIANPGPTSRPSNTLGSLHIFAAPRRVFDELSEKRQNKITTGYTALPFHNIAES